jgi:BirA family transcriptional regulator, biotin operon repressor / biotin---[acetyl-CoA-carboxylase] ligase
MTSRLYHFERVDSTMDVIHALAADGAEAGTAVLAAEQLGGRGSRGRSWHSPPGGLWLSMLVRPPATGGVEVISLRAGLVVAEAIEPLLGDPIRLKWPNDLMLGERKIGGILCEARWQGQAVAWVAVGVGMNVRNSIPPELSESAGSLVLEQPDITVEQVAERTVSALRTVDLGADRLTPAELERFAQRDWLYGRDLRAPAAGTAAGLQDDGALLVQAPDGSRMVVRSGSIELAAVSSNR